MRREPAVNSMLCSETREPYCLREFVSANAKWPCVLHWVQAAEGLFANCWRKALSWAPVEDLPDVFSHSCRRRQCSSLSETAFRGRRMRAWTYAFWASPPRCLLPPESFSELLPPSADLVPTWSQL